MTEKIVTKDGKRYIKFVEYYGLDQARSLARFNSWMLKSIMLFSISIMLIIGLAAGIQAVRLIGVM